MAEMTVTPERIASRLASFLRNSVAKLSDEWGCFKKEEFRETWESDGQFGRITFAHTPTGVVWAIYYSLPREKVFHCSFVVETPEGHRIGRFSLYENDSDPFSQRNGINTFCWLKGGLLGILWQLYREKEIPFSRNFYSTSIMLFNVKHDIYSYFPAISTYSEHYHLFIYLHPYVLKKPIIYIKARRRSVDDRTELAFKAHNWHEFRDRMNALIIAVSIDEI